MSWTLDHSMVITAFVVGLVAHWWVRHVLAKAHAVPSTRDLAGRPERRRRARDEYLVSGESR
jgi:hypothetical protein